MLSLGIVGLPNAGKSSLFKALTRMQVPIANYPFTTIEPHHGIVAVPDERLEKLAKLTPGNKVLPTVIEFVDIAGLIRGAHKGEGLGNQFLSHIREVDALVEVVRAFEEKTVPHPMETVDPERDIAIIDEELIQSDLKVLERAAGKYRGWAKSGNQLAQEKFGLLERAIIALTRGTPLRDAPLDAEDKKKLGEFNLLTAKPVLFACNVNESSSSRPSAMATTPQQVRGGEPFGPEGLTTEGLAESIAAIAEGLGNQAITAPLRLFADFADLPDADAASLKKEYGFEKDPLELLIRKAYEILDLITFFTVKPPETRAWTVKRDMLLPDAGAAIHTDFQEKFIRAEVIHIEELLGFENWQAAKSSGKVRTEGKECVVHDGDVIEFKI